VDEHLRGEIDDEAPSDRPLVLRAFSVEMRVEVP